MAEPEPIAIVGMGCRLPGSVSSPEDLWQLLSEGRDGWSKVPADRWNAEAFYHPDGESIQAYNAKGGYFLTHDVADFDARFFASNTNEADASDPQQRLLLETTYEALENAGIPIESLRGSDTAVYAAVFARDYDRLQWKDANNVSRLHLGGTGEAIIANRLSYVFDFRGASMTIDTGCSGSLVALHEACLALRTRQTRMAVVGGTETLLGPDQFICMGSAGMLNPEGKCFTFDHRGKGYGRGEGAATVIVKRLSDAIEDGDNIHAVIRNTASNQDGKTNGITNPSSEAQEALVRSVYKNAGLDPRDTLYIEAHGTGTLAGDAAEINSIGRVFSEHKRERNIFVGSVKTNLGHTEATSGLAGVIKAVLVLQHQQIPPNLNFEKPKPGLDLEQRQITVPLSLEPLVPEGHQGPIRASVNSFGYGGTNCHVILDRFEHTVPKPVAPSTNGHHENGHSVNGLSANGHDSNGHDSDGHPSNGDSSEAQELTGNPALLFPLSAQSETSLEAMPKILENWISRQEMDHAALRDLSYTLSCRRSRFAWRQAFVASTSAELLTELQGPTSTKVRAARATKVAFVFTGQGAQWAGMGRDLLATSETFRKAMDKAAAMLKTFGAKWELLEELARPEGESRINESALAQPVTTIIQMALVDLLRDYGVQPSWVVGHSSGEIAAAYSAGILSTEDAIRSAFYRGKSSSVAKALNDLPGTMLAVGLGEQAAVQAILDAKIEESKGRVTVACVNSPTSTTLSGDEPAIDALYETLAAAGVFARKLKVETAYHSHHMEKVAKSYSASLAEVKPNAIREGIQFVSSVTGTTKTTDFGAEYWTRNLVSQVRFNDAVSHLVQNMQASGNQDDANVFIEIGPHSALQGPLRQVLSATPDVKWSYFAPLTRGKNASSTFTATIARLFELGVSLKLQSAFVSAGGAATPRVLGNVTRYPWDHRVKYWREPRFSRDYRLRQFPYHDLCGLYDVQSSIDEPRWRHQLSLDRLPWIRHHIVDGQVVFPLTGYTCMMVESLNQLVQMRHPGSKIAKYVVKDQRVHRPIILAQEQDEEAGPDVEVQLILSPSKSSVDSPWYTARILSLQPDGKWAEHLTTQLRFELQASAGVDAAPAFGDEHSIATQEAFEALDRITALATQTVDPEVMYAEHRKAGNDWGPSFALVNEASMGQGVALAKLQTPDMTQWMPHGYSQPHLVHPATLDATVHMLATLFHKQIINAPLMPVKTDESIMTSDMLSKPGIDNIVAIDIKPLGKTAGRGNVWMFQRAPDSGELKLVCSFSGVQLQAVGEEAEETAKLFERENNTEVVWTEDPSLLNEATFNALTKPHAESTPEFYDRLDLNEKAAMIYLDKVKDLVVVRSPETAPLPHLQHFCKWISAWTASESFRNTIDGMRDEDKAAILERSSRLGSHEGALLETIGQSLQSILDNTVTSLDASSDSSLWSSWYKDGPMLPARKQMTEYFKILAHKNPHLSIVEIGAGTGNAAAHFLEAVGDNAAALVKQYCFTDNSADHFETGKAALKKWESLLNFKVLDISKDPVEQGFERHQFDVVVASDVLRTASSASETLQNVQKILKPGGRLLLVESHRQSAAVNTVLGTLPGWWELKDGQMVDADLNPSEWNDCLVSNSFSGIEFSATDCDGPLARFSFIVAQLIDTAADKPVSEAIPVPESMRIIHRGTSSVTQELAEALLPGFEATGLPTQLATWKSLADASHTVEQNDPSFYVVLDSANSSVLVRPNPEEFGLINAIMSGAQFILWVTFQEDGVADVAAEVVGKPDVAAVKALVHGLARVVRRENEGVKLLTLEAMDPVTKDNTSELLTYVNRLAALIHTPRVEHTSQGCDSEFVISGGRCLVPRLLPDTHFIDWADRVNHRNKVEEHLYNDPNLPLKLEVGTPGLLSSLHFVRNDVIATPLADDEIQIDAKAYGVNFRDVLIGLGQMRPDSPMAGEVSGIVTAVGSGSWVQERYKVGDRVYGLKGQAYASQTRIKGTHAHVLPHAMESWADGASISIVFTTVYYSFVHLARLRRGQTVLIHAATGAVGQAAIQYAQHVGAVVFATASSLEKRQTLVDNYGIPESHILNARAAPLDLKRKILRMTNNRGVDVVLNSIAGEMLAESWDCIASFGIHIELGKADITRNNHLSMAPFDRNVTFASVDLFAFCNEREDDFYEMSGEVVALFNSGVFTPVKPVMTMPIGQLEAAFRLIAERKHMGKVVLEIPDGAVVQAVLPPPPRARLAKDGTYLVAGGLGDIGSRLISLLVTLGAGHIVALTRKNLDQADHDAFVAKHAAPDSTIHIAQCDITNSESVRKLLDHCQKALPAVRGIINCGVVLRDHPLVDMTVDDWNTVLGPKVHGTWNLDNAFSSPDLDFFIMLTSVAGVIGNPAQTNYSAANNFQDAYARHHPKSFNTRYTALALPPVGGSGYIVDLIAAGEYARLERLGSHVMSFDEVMQLAEYSMQNSEDMPSRTQAVMGFDRKSIMAMPDSFWTPMFETLPRLESADADGSGLATAKRDIEGSLKAAATMDEAVDIIAQATLEKFAVFLNVSISDLSVHQAPASIGLDSLVSIELKNWIVRTFKATLQASELTSAPSILGLAGTLAMRSKFVSAELRSQKSGGQDGEEGDEAQTKTQSKGVLAKEDSQTRKEPCCPVPDETPRLPVPDFDTAMQNYMDGSAHLAQSEEERTTFQTAVQEFTAPDGVARKVYENIKHRAADPATGGNWANDYLREHTYLRRREPTQYTSFCAVYHPGRVPQTQAEVAALLAITAFQYKKEIDNGTLEPAFVLGTPICMAFDKWLFNTARIPGIGRDMTVKGSGDYCVVLRRGRAFVVPLHEAGQDVSLRTVKKTIDAILNNVQDQGTWAGILTSDSRDSWAKVRDGLLSVGPQNGEYFSTLESAAFVVCLDDGSPETPEECAKHCRLGDGSNRWHDKCVQFTVAANGRAGVIFEHSFIDGTLPVPLHDRISAAIDEYRPAEANGTDCHLPEAPRELELATTAEADQQIAILKEKWAAFSDARDFLYHEVPGLGQKFITGHNLPLKGTYDATLQLAMHLYYGTLPVSWQPMALTHFHEGRHDLVQLNSPPVRAFCDAATDESMSLSDRRALLLKAALDMNARIRDSKDGKGHYRLLHVIDKQFPADEPRAAIFTHPLQRRLDNFTNITYINPPNFEGYMVSWDPNALRLKYTIRQDSCAISTVCGQGKAEDLTQAIERAVLIIKELIQASFTS
ncbi:hypothetical protein Micbo1qcDRAFT_209040 [Microdochium bolleyi]|uniref:Uncharacterized protein n=1 Tax=Microdochium bolleyi TaxID=196109 RepID=A0A136IN82_9PEZI|nr:hypothetical protein Micbo1qcDRAFT_209040 [Microdochium bolleyi]